MRAINNLNNKLFLIPIIGILNYKFQTSQLFTKKNKNIIHCASNGEEEPSPGARSINSRMSKIEQKLDFLISKENLQIDLKDYPKLSKSSDSLLSRILDEATWKRNYMLKTEEGYDINDIIQAGVDNTDHPIGLCAPSKDAYYTFEDILIKAASSFHNRNIQLTKFEKENYQMLKNILNSAEDYFKNIIQGIEITTNRNLDGYAFSSKLARSNRREVARNILNVIKTEESDVFEDNGKFINLDKEMNFKDMNPFYRSCGFYRDWPDGRLVYTNKSTSMIINEEDHIKLIGKFNKSENCEPVKDVLNYIELLDKLESKLNLSFDSNLGFVNSLVNNLGTACYFKIKIKIDEAKVENFRNFFKNHSELRFDSGENKDTLIISNNSSFYSLTQFLIDLLSAKTLN